MKIIICGAIGSGKTTLSHHIENEYNYTYISDWDIFKNNGVLVDSNTMDYSTKTMHSHLILDSVINTKDNVVVDCDFSVSPSVAKEYQDITIIYLGFNSLKEDVLFDLFNKNDSGSKYTKTMIKDIKNLSHSFYTECQKLGLRFFDITKEKSLVQKDVLDYLNL